MTQGRAGDALSILDAPSATPLPPRGLVLRDFDPAMFFEYRAIWSEGMSNPFDRAAFLRLLSQCAEEILSEAPPGRVTRLA